MCVRVRACVCAHAGVPMRVEVGTTCLLWLHDPRSHTGTLDVLYLIYTCTHIHIRVDAKRVVWRGVFVFVSNNCFLAVQIIPHPYNRLDNPLTQ